MSETGKLAGILASDVVGCSLLTGADEDTRQQHCSRLAFAILW
jgi:hypothetical protein